MTVEESSSMASREHSDHSVWRNMNTWLPANW